MFAAYLIEMSSITASDIKHNSVDNVLTQKLSLEYASCVSSTYSNVIDGEPQAKKIVGNIHDHVYAERLLVYPCCNVDECGNIHHHAYSERLIVIGLPILQC